MIRVPNKDLQEPGLFRTIARTVTNDEGEFSLRGMPQTGPFELLIGDKFRSDWLVTPVAPGGKSVVDMGTVRLRPRMKPE